ncbi:MAG: ATP-grasp domain-containing protein [Thermoanaerobaculia bacterium]|nr:ATP-grasp domain-containing protein [Thermoanaerobaculia bacterium]
MICAIVDAISTGSGLPYALSNRGARCVQVATPIGRRLIEREVIPQPDLEWVQSGFDYLPNDPVSRSRGVPRIPSACGDFPSLVLWARRQGVTHVLAGSEPGVELADSLADALDLPGNSVELSRARRDKDTMSRTLHYAGVPVPDSLRTSNPTSAVRFWNDELGGTPVVVKPLSSAGGNGVTFCRDEAEIRAAFSDLVGSLDLFGTRNESLLVQRQMSGRLFEVCTVSDSGRHEVVLVVETTKQAAVFDAMRLLTPREVAERDAVVDVALRALDALEIRFGAAHVEVLVGPDAVVVIEVAARLIGFLPPQLSREALNTDQVERLADVTLCAEAISVAPTAPEREIFARAVALRSDAEGPIREQQLGAVEARLLELPSVRRVHFLIARDRRLEVTCDLPSAPGLVELLHEDPEQVAADHVAIRKLERDGLWRSLLDARLTS